MKFVGMILLMGIGSAFAATSGYDLKINFSKNGKPVSSPHLIVKTGELTTVTQKTDAEESFIEVVATEGEVQSQNGIMMKFTVGTIDKNGKRTIVFTPQILAKENEAAEITVGENGGAEQLSLSVVAKRKSL